MHESGAFPPFHMFTCTCTCIYMKGGGKHVRGSSQYISCTYISNSFKTTLKRNSPVVELCSKPFLRIASFVS